MKSPKWNLSQMQKHLLTSHSIQSIDEIPSDDEDIIFEENDSSAESLLRSQSENDTPSTSLLHPEQSQVDSRNNHEEGKILQLNV